MRRQEAIGRYRVAASATRRSGPMLTLLSGCDSLLSTAPQNADFDGSLSDPLPRINLDANANAKPTPAVIAAIVEALKKGANPSSAHGAGDDARRLLEAARDALCDLCSGVFPENVIFTSGCTEANNLVVASCVANGASLITTEVEHPSVLRPAEAFAAGGGTLHLLGVSADGLVDLTEVEALLATSSGPVILSVQVANSETGVRQPIADIARIAAGYDHVLFHADAAQAFGKMPLVLGGAEGPDVITVSGHKVHGPMGIGAVLMVEGETRLRPLLLGGEQERGLRAGTQPLPLAAGFAAACAERRENFDGDVASMAALRNRFELTLKTALPQIRINGFDAPRLANTSNICFPGIDAMALVALIDAEGIEASQGSACSSQRPEPSHVLTAMGLNEADAFASVRFSMSPLNTFEQIDEATLIIVAACRHLGIAT